MPNAHFAYVLGRASSRVSVHGIGRASRVVWNRGASAHGISRRLYPSFPFVLDSIPQQVADSIRSLCERFHPRHGVILQGSRLAFSFARPLARGQAHAVLFRMTSYSFLRNTSVILRKQEKILTESALKPIMKSAHGGRMF